MEKQIKKILEKKCVCCGKNVKIILYSKNNYRGGHYFDKIPLHTKSELRLALKAGSHKKVFGKTELLVLNQDPKPYAYAEYWECPKCYWGR